MGATSALGGCTNKPSMLTIWATPRKKKSLLESYLFARWELASLIILKYIINNQNN